MTEEEMNTHRRIEEMSLNGWPALQTVHYDGWLLRLAEGYTKRSNSVSVLHQGAIRLEDKIAYCEQFYESRGQTPVFKITSFADGLRLDEQLERRAYRKLDHTLVKSADLSRLAEPVLLQGFDYSLTPEPTEEWLKAIGGSGMQHLQSGQLETKRRILAGIPLKKAFIMLREGGKPVACGVAVMEAGWAGLYDIVTDRDCRGRGFGEQIMRLLLDWARREGARQSYLLVVKSNAAANRLYDKFGFRELYDNWYRVKTTEELQTPG
ncbi:GNAT family N-acetyltransferase [Paenibacillus sp. HB172176]|uniref:GNAT family N-acetyltransferase n=1 Tax=Paenibacillus sp. HB172176 TaxID=2493690 RepID=UPI0014393D71|nr:GNAT family N-acetyltransferase [Paenibacillus sp. HB172176]